MPAANDTEVDTDEHQSQRSLQLPFDIDDAFSEGDDPDLSYNFTVTAIRAELAKSISNGVVTTEGINGNGLSSDGSVVGTDASVSTLDINGPALTSPFSPPSEISRASSYQTYHSFATIENSSSSEFSQISLSDEPFQDSLDVAGSNDLRLHPAIQIHTSEEIPDVEEIQIVSEGELPPSPPSAPPTEPSRSGSLRAHSPPDSAPSSTHGRTDSVNPTATAIASITPSLSAPDGRKPDTIKRHRPTRSAGPSALDKVVSKTRPTFLPPKAHDEDRKHLADWEYMMKQSRVIENKKRRATEERRLARERRAEESIHIWEKEILPDWRVVNKNPAMRKLWWQGIPTKLRAFMWERAVGNSLAISKDNYRTCLARAKRSLAVGTFPTTTLSLMDQDIRDTLPALHLFHPDSGAMYGDLKDMLCAWVVSRSDEGLGYTMGVSKVAAMFLLNMPPSEGFVAMRNLLERHCMRSFYGGVGARDDVQAYYRIFDTLLADAMPKIYFNFKQHQLSPSAYLPDWIIPMFLNHLDITTCAHIWDVLLLEGDSFLYRAALAVLAVLEPRLFFPDRKELLELLRGENAAALEVAKRERIPVNGPKYDIYGVDEEVLWEKIESMGEWWKDSTWTRLISRELPDL